MFVVVAFVCFYSLFSLLISKYPRQFPLSVFLGFFCFAFNSTAFQYYLHVFLLLFALPLRPYSLQVLKRRPKAAVFWDCFFFFFLPPPPR